MKDIQNQLDYRNIPIDKVGIKDLKYPITVLDRMNNIQHTVASINMYVDLPHNYKGTHMSRFVEMLHLFRPEVSLKKISVILEEMKEYLNAASANIEVTFPYFIEKKSPVSKSPGLMDYICSFLGSSDPNGKIDLYPSSSFPSLPFVLVQKKSVNQAPTINAGRFVSAHASTNLSGLKI